MTLREEHLHLIQSILSRHGIERAWLLETDPTELVVMLHVDDLTRVDRGAIEDELSSGLRPHRKVWVTALQERVNVGEDYTELSLRSAFDTD